MSKLSYCIVLYIVKNLTPCRTLSPLSLFIEAKLSGGPAQCVSNICNSLSNMALNNCEDRIWSGSNPLRTALCVSAAVQ